MSELRKDFSGKEPDEEKMEESRERAEEGVDAEGNPVEEPDDDDEDEDEDDVEKSATPWRDRLLRKAEEQQEASTGSDEKNPGDERSDEPPPDDGDDDGDQTTQPGGGGARLERAVGEAMKELGIKDPNKVGDSKLERMMDRALEIAYGPRDKAKGSDDSDDGEPVAKALGRKPCGCRDCDCDKVAKAGTVDRRKVREMAGAVMGDMALDDALSQMSSAEERDALLAELRKLRAAGGLTARKSLTLDFELRKAAKGEQAANHKYVRREPNGRGGWRYFYRDENGKEYSSDKKPTLVQVPDELKAELKKYQLDLLPQDDVVGAIDVAMKIASTLNKIWADDTDFCKVRPPACVGNLGIPRSDMPQILNDTWEDLNDPEGDQQWKAEAAIAAGLDASKMKPETKISDMFLDRLRKQGVDISEPREQHLSSLRATQSEIKAGKATAFAHHHMMGKWQGGAACDLSKDPIVVSKDGYILDGHHRYAALLMLSGKMTMMTTVVDMTMEDMLTESLKMPGVYRADLNDNVVDGPAPDYAAYAEKARKEVERVEQASKRVEGGMSVEKGGLYTLWQIGRARGLGVL